MTREELYDLLEDEKLYIAYYKGIPFIAGYDKKMVKKYMEDYRQVPKKQYHIEKIFPTNLQLLRYEPIMLEYYEGFYLASRDVSILNIFESDISRQLKQLCQDNFNMCSLIGQLDGSEKYVKKLIDVCKALSKIYYDKEMMGKLHDISVANSPLIYCDIETYITSLKSYQDLLDNIYHYRSICDSDYIHI